MRRWLLGLFIVLLTASQLPAETYSWVDGNGVWNFSDDYYSVPKKYRKSVRRSGDDDSSRLEQKAPLMEKNQTTAAKPEPAAEADKRLYNGETQEMWRKKLDLQETELKRLEVRLEELQKMINARPDQYSRGQRSEMFREYESVRVEYKEKYKIYSDLIESARKAGLMVEMKK